MANRAAAVLSKALHSVLKDDRSALTDRDLLHQFVRDGDQSAFTTLVGRHTPMVLGVCRRALGNVQDAEDACQATFLVLARKAREGVRWQASVANYLYTTARRVARNARVSAERRARREAKAAVPEAVLPVDRMTGRELLAALDVELDGLPPCYREPLILCYLEGLTRDEAAARLGITAPTLRTRLDRGRKRLHEALTRSGCALGAGLLALAVTSPAGASPPRLVQSILAAASGSVPEAVAELAKGVAVNGVLNKGVVALVAAAVVVALGVGFGSLKSPAGPPPRQPQPQPAASRPKEKDEKPDQETPKEVTYAGRVVDPDGKPFAGAKLYALYYTPKVLPVPERATSDKEGNFRFTVQTKEFDRSVSAQPWYEVAVFAAADGYGLGYCPVFQPGKLSPTDLTVRLAKDDAPITGRVLDLQGKPVAGASAVVHEFMWPSKDDDLTPFLAALKEKKDWYGALVHRLGQAGLYMGRDIGRILPSAVTDADGRFTLKGVGRERVVALRVEGPTIMTTEHWVMTRAGEKIQIAAASPGTVEVTLLGASFEHIATPSLPVVGVVSDKGTGKPIPGAIIETYAVGQGPVQVLGRPATRAVADKDGQYRLNGLPKAAGSRIRITPPEDQPYLSTVVGVTDGPGLGPVTINVKLTRGVWITGKVTDKATGKPVPSWIQYAVFGDNPNIQEAPGLIFDHDMKTRPEDGTFRFVGLPGRGAVTATAWQGRGYLTRIGADKIKDFDRFLTPAGGAFGAFRSEFHTVGEVKPEKGAESATCDLVLDPGKMLTCSIVGPDGKPLAGALIRGLDNPDVWDNRPAGPEFSVLAPKPGDQNLLQFTHPEKKLAGSLVVKSDDRGPLTVKLGPAGVLTGRFMTTDGKPLAGLELFAQTREPVADPLTPQKVDVTVGSFPRGPRTDKDGKFRVEGLTPGLNYRLGVYKGMYALTPEGDAAKGVTVKTGETMDLGEIKVKLINE